MNIVYLWHLFKVEILQESFDLKDAAEGRKLLLQIYNYTTHIRSYQLEKDVGAKLKSLTEEGRKLQSLHSSLQESRNSRGLGKSNKKSSVGTKLDAVEEESSEGSWLLVCQISKFSYKCTQNYLLRHIRITALIVFRSGIFETLMTSFTGKTHWNWSSNRWPIIEDRLMTACRTHQIIVRSTLVLTRLSFTLYIAMSCPTSSG